MPASPNSDRESFGKELGDFLMSAFVPMEFMRLTHETPQLRALQPDLPSPMVSARQFFTEVVRVMLERETIDGDFFADSNGVYDGTNKSSG